ncbi:MAG: acyl--CoA ligase [Verrucomicrobia bacterium]|nr:acyl--CoA ligase [Verrucomicrobiota bacterium]
MSVKRGQNYHTVQVTQVEPRLFDCFWKRVLKDRSRHPAILADDGSILRTFQDIEEERSLWRARLPGFSEGDCVVGALGNDPSWPALLLACWDRGLIIAPTEPDIPAVQLDRILQLTQAQGLVRAKTIQRLGYQKIAWKDPRPDLLKITSGTTGAPRTVRFRESQLLADCRNICETMGIRPEDVSLGVIPFSHSYGFSNLIAPLLFQGTALVCSNDRMPRAVYHHLQKCGATVFPGTPALFQALGSLSDTTEPVPTRLCISAGAPLGPETSRQFHQRFGRKIHSFYGSSECGGIAYDREDELERSSGFAGTPLCGVDVVTIDKNRIAVLGPNVADGYFPASDEAILDGKRFVPGDLVEWSNEGLRLIGRVTDFVNVAGNKVHPSIVEEHLRKLPGVVDAIVFGIPSVTRNEDLVAYVVGSPQLSRQVLESHCREGLSSWQVPRDIQIVGQLPFNNRGKINRSELSKLHMESRSEPEPD